MKARILNEQAGRTHLLIFAAGDEVLGSLGAFVREKRINGAWIMGLGAVERAKVGFFDPNRKEYVTHEIAEQTEVLSLTGNAGWLDREPRIHAHVVLGRANGAAIGGHLMSAIVRPTLEVLLIETVSRIRRGTDAATGLALIIPEPEPACGD